VTGLSGFEPRGVQGRYGRASGPRAGFWKRFLGLIIDDLIVGIVNELLARVTSRGTAEGISFLLAAAYATYFMGSRRGQTPGQMAVRVRVIGMADGQPIGYQRAFVRWLGTILSGLALGLGYLWMLWDPEKQTWHDKLSGSVVVPIDAYPVE
jgi:uncharacterized RDD family membrane protein YckC